MALKFVALPMFGVSVPSRALCVLRQVTLVPYKEEGESCFSALSSFVCSATGQDHQRSLRTGQQGWFQCPLELCVFCDLEVGALKPVHPGQLFQCPLELCVFCDLTPAISGGWSPY